MLFKTLNLYYFILYIYIYSNINYNIKRCLKALSYMIFLTMVIFKGPVHYGQKSLTVLYCFMPDGDGGSYGQNDLCWELICVPLLFG